MTDPQYARLVIIIAGYRNQTSHMLDTNPGLKSRFNHFMEFPDWGASDCVDQISKRAEHGHFEVQPEARDVLQEGFSKLVDLSGWGNARDVNDVWRAMLRERANRVVDLPPESVKMLIAADVRPTIDDKIKARAVDATMPITAHTLAAPISLPPPPPPVPPSRHNETRKAEPAAETETTDEGVAECKVEAVQEATVACPCSIASTDEMRDDGVSDEDWAELQQAKEEERRREAEVLAELQRLEDEKMRLEAEHAEQVFLMPLYQTDRSARFMSVRNKKVVLSRRNTNCA